jgi:WD40 repeat protein
MHQQLNLTIAEVESIESRITAEVEIYHQKLQEYERLFANVAQQEYPLSEASRANLRQQQQRLGLKDVEIAPIEAKITTQIETYQQKLQQYEQAYVKATQHKHYPDEVTCKQLQQTWQTLGLSEVDVETIESRINAEIKTHQENLRQYEQEFAEAVQQEYPLNTIKRTKFTERYRSLNLTAEDVEAIESPIVKVIEEHRQKLQQYEQVFRESIQFEYPLSDATHEELKRFQHILELGDGDISQIEARVLEQKVALNQSELTPRENLEQDEIKNSVVPLNSSSTPSDSQQSDKWSSRVHPSKTLSPKEVVLGSKLKSGTLQARHNNSQIAQNRNLPFADRFFELPFVGRTSGGIILGAIGGAILALGGYIYLSYNPCIINNSISPYCKVSVSGTATLGGPSVTLDGTSATLGGISAEPVAISSDNRFLVADRAIREFPTGTALYELAYFLFPQSIAISPDNKTLVIGFGNNTIRVWNLQTGRQVRDLQGHSGSDHIGVNSVAISPDSKILVSADDNGTIKIWDLATGGEIRSFKAGDIISSIAISPDGKSLVVAGDGIEVLDLATGNQIREFSSGSFISASFSSDGKILAASEFTSIRVWDFETGNQLWRFNSAGSVVIDPNGNTLFAIDNRRTKLWNLTTGRFIRTFDRGGHLAIGSDGKSFVIDPHDDLSLDIWQVSD